jgi:hypothetical protein
VEYSKNLELLGFSNNEGERQGEREESWQTLTADDSIWALFSLRNVS